MVKEPDLWVLPDPKAGFRVLPYLQDPTSTSVRLVWISEIEEAGTATVTTLNGMVTKASSLVYMPLNEYTDAERKQEIEFSSVKSTTISLEKGSWLYSDYNFRHEVLIENLTPNTKYSYKVTQGGIEHV